MLMFITVTGVENQKRSIRLLTFVNTFLPRRWTWKWSVPPITRTQGNGISSSCTTDPARRGKKAAYPPTTSPTPSCWHLSADDIVEGLRRPHRLERVVLCGFSTPWFPRHVAACRRCTISAGEKREGSSPSRKSLCKPQPA